MVDHQETRRRQENGRRNPERGRELFDMLEYPCRPSHVSIRRCPVK